MTHHSYCAPVHSRSRIRLWIPISLIWLLLLPFAVLLAPIVFVAGLVFGVNPFQAVAVYWEIFMALRGVRVAIQNPPSTISNS